METIMFARTDGQFDESIRNAMKKVKSLKTTLHEDIQPVEGIEEIGVEGRPDLDATIEIAMMLISDMKDAHEVLVEKLNEIMTDDDIMAVSKDLSGIVGDMKNTLDELEDDIQTVENVFS